MTKTGNGTFKYVSGYYDPATLVPGVVTATYDGKVKNAQLVISHGCRPYTQGAWCSPGFWKNAEAAAWAPTGYTAASMFNGNASTYWYGADLADGTTLGTVLGSPKTYSGPPVAGTSEYPLNAFNATGAFLTNALPGYHFDYDLLAAAQSGASEQCPIDHHGNWK